MILFVSKARYRTPQNKSIWSNKIDSVYFDI